MYFIIGAVVFFGFCYIGYKRITRKSATSTTPGGSSGPTGAKPN